MAKQKQAVRSVKCSKCGASTMTNPGARHRRCPGKLDAPPRKKADKLEPGARGTWE